MEENITSDNNECTEVKLTRAQKYGSAPVEGSTSMASDKAEILALLPMLTEEEKAVILGSIKFLLSEQESNAAAPVSIGQ